MKIEFSSFSAIKWFVVSFLTNSQETITSPVPVIGIVRVDSIGTASNFTFWGIKQEFIMLGSIKLRLSPKHLFVKHDLLRNVWFIASDWWKIIQSSERRILRLSWNRMIRTSVVWFPFIKWAVFITFNIYSCFLSWFHLWSLTLSTVSKG